MQDSGRNIGVVDGDVTLHSRGLVIYEGGSPKAREHRKKR